MKKTLLASLLLFACNGAPPEAVSSQALHINPFPFPIPPVARGYGPRNQCSFASGGNISTATQAIAGELPVPEPDLGRNCVETGYPVWTSPGIVQVDLDNPRLFARSLLPSFTLRDGSHHPCQVEDHLGGTTNYYCDLFDAVNGGDGAPAGFMTGGSVATTLYPLLRRDEMFSAPATPTMLVDGLRVGYSPLDTQLYVVSPTGPSQIDTFPVTLQLNPDVLLVPIEAVAIESANVKVPSYDLPSMLALFDRVSSVDNQQRAIDSYGDLTVESRTSAHRVVDRADGYGVASGFVLPDDVWSQCGIQFRLVNQFTMLTDDDHAQPSDTWQNTGVDDLTPFRQNRDQAQQDGRHLERVPQVLFPNRCSFRDVPTRGVTDDRLQVACAGMNADDYVLSHELGHILGLDEGYDSRMQCVIPNDPQNVMCLNGGYHVTPEQCTSARRVAQDTIDLIKSTGRAFYKP